MDEHPATPEQLVLLAHGSRDSRWTGVFENGLGAINGRLDREASLAYLEMASPGLEEVIHRHYRNGVRRIRVLPLFFAAGRHLLHDVPEQIRALEAALPGLHIDLLEALGHHPHFWESLGAMIARRVNG